MKMLRRGEGGGGLKFCVCPRGLSKSVRSREGRKIWR